MNSSKGISIAALVCGILGIVLSIFYAHWILPILGLIIAVVGIVLGAIGMKKAKELGEPKGLAIAGLVCGIVGAVFAGIFTICAICVCTAVQRGGAELTNYLNNL